MKALIVCEGFYSEGEAKIYPPLVRLKNGETVFERQIRLMSENGITQFIIAADAHRIKLSEIIAAMPHTGLSFEWTDNPKFFRTSSIFSLSLADGLEDTIYVSGGLVYSKSVLEYFLSYANESAVAVVEHPENGHFVRAITEDGYIRQAGGDNGEDTLAVLPICRIVECTEDESRIRAVQIENGFIMEVISDHDTIEASRSISHFDLVEQLVISGVYSILELEAMLSRYHIHRPLVVTSSELPRVMKLYLESILEEYAVFETALKVPDKKDIQAGCGIFRQSGCDSIISFGGPAAHDTAKLIRLAVQLGDSFDIQHPQLSMPTIRHLAIPASVEGGSEALPTACYTVNGQQRQIEYDGLLADCVIIEPKLFQMLTPEDKKNAALEALCLCVESLWSIHGNSISMGIAETALASLLNSVYCVVDDSVQLVEEFLTGRHNAIKAAHISGVTVAYHIACRLAEALQIPNGMAAGAIAAHFWKYYSDNLVKCKRETVRKKIAEKLHTIKNTLNVNTSLELKEMVTFMISLFLDNRQLVLSDPVVENVFNSLDLRDVSNTPVHMDISDIQSVVKEAVSKTELWRNTEPQAKIRINSQREFRNHWKERLASSVLEKIKKIEAEILSETVRFCEENNLQYFLSYGTLLGAARHKGFIPWNDNIEISMPMEDYKKFNKLAGQGFGGSFYIQTGIKDPYCWFDGTRVCKEHTHIENSRDRFFYSPKRGIFITVLPMGRVTRLNGLAVLRFKMARAIDAVIEYRLNPSSRKLRIRASLIMKFSRPFSIKSLHKFRIRLLGSQKGSTVLLGHRYSAKQEILPARLIFPLTKVEFEGCLYNAPKDSDAILKKLYGDYKVIPAEQDRVSPKPIRVFFDKNEQITLITGKLVASEKSLIYLDNLLSTKRNALQASIMKKLKGVFGPTRLPRRTLTRIAGFFRVMGLRPSENTKRLASYRNKYAGQRCFLIGNGPSLKAEDLDMLAGEVTFGCNLIHKIYEQTKWRPTFYCISDSGITRTHSRELVDNIDCSTLMIREFAYRYMEVKPWDALKLPYISVPWYKVHGNMLEYHYISHATIMSMMIELAFYMGFKEVYLLGVDGTSASKAGSHFTDSYFTAAMKEYSDSVKKRIYKNYDPAVRAAYLQRRTLEIFKTIREYADRKGLKVYNATRGGVIEIFERADLDRILNK